MTGSPLRATSRRGLAPTLLALALGACDAPDILVDAARTDTSLSLGVYACPPTLDAPSCQQGHPVDQLLPVSSINAATHRTLGIVNQAGVETIRLLFNQNGPSVVIHCLTLDVRPPPRAPSRVTVRAQLPLDVKTNPPTCDPPGQCDRALECL